MDLKERRTESTWNSKICELTELRRHEDGSRIWHAWCVFICASWRSMTS